MSARLDLINSMISTTGTSPLGSTDTAHPDYIDASGVLDNIIEEITAQAMWFNTEVRTLQADVNGEVVVPSLALSAEATDRSDKVRIRGTRLWDYANHTFTLDKDIEVKLLINVDLDDMPPIVRQWIRASARYEYFVDKDGAVAKTQFLKEKLDRIHQQMRAQNVRLSNINFFDSKAAANFYVRRGYTERGRIVR